MAERARHDGVLAVAPFVPFSIDAARCHWGFPCSSYRAGGAFPAVRSGGPSSTSSRPGSIWRFSILFERK
jgi:hypothetical protein